MPDLPTGTVTYLFTDIEGSTVLVQELGERWADLLARHSAILRSAIAAGGGTEVSTEGDAFFAVFPKATGAVSASAAAQRALVQETWPEARQLRVRMGLHTGEAILGGDDYIGLDVHRAARIAAAGHGGQVLLSDSTRALAEPGLPADMVIRDLGEHRLKDLARPERLFQLVIAGLPSDFPELRTLDARPNNLPVQLTSFVGREEEIAAVGRLLDKARLVTLTGPGGAGKTRLALQVAAEVLSRFRDGAFFVELAPVTDPDLVVSTIASTVGVLESPERPLEESVHEWLSTRNLLLMLDNFEQVTKAAPVVGALLASAPNVRVLVTSRAILHLHGEHEFAVQPLRVPDPTHLPAIETLTDYEAVALFIERARAARADFTVTPESAQHIAEIAVRLDGLPLAIELAAARTKLFGPEAILTRLEGRLAFLTGGPRDLPARQQTLRGAIEWSYELLDEPEQTLFRRLSVFMGGWTLEAAEAVAIPGDLGLDAVGALEGLTDESLIRALDSGQGEPRFTMLETIREFAAELLTGAGEAPELRRRHADHFLMVAEAAEPLLTGSAEVVDRVDREHDNLRAALGWAIESGDASVGLRLGYALWRYWHLRAHFREARDWFERLLGLPAAAARSGERALGLTGAAGIAYWQNDYPAAERWYEEAESIYRELGDERRLADALFNTASMAGLRGDMDAAHRKMAEGANIARGLDDLELVMKFLEAEGYMAFMSDDLETARRLLEEALALAEQEGSPFHRAVGYHTVAQVDRLEGRYADAVTRYHRSLELAHQMGASAPMIEPLQGLAAVAVATGDPIRGVRLLGGADAIRERVGGGPPPEWIRLGDPLGDARQAIGDQTVEKALAEGRAMPEKDLVRYAMSPAESGPT